MENPGRRDEHWAADSGSMEDLNVGTPVPGWKRKGPMADEFLSGLWNGGLEMGSLLS
jgi:hypothetical protein